MASSGEQHPESEFPSVGSIRSRWEQLSGSNTRPEPAINLKKDQAPQNASETRLHEPTTAPDNSHALKPVAYRPKHSAPPPPILPKPQLVDLSSSGANSRSSSPPRERQTESWESPGSISGTGRLHSPQSRLSPPRVGSKPRSPSPAKVSSQTML